MSASTLGRWAPPALHLLAWGVTAYAVLAYALLPPGALTSPAMQQVYLAHPVAIYGHVFGAAVALALGPLQLWRQRRGASPRGHRWIGRLVLLAGVGLGGLCGLALSAHAQGGTVARLGFASLAVAWLYTGLRGWLAIRGHRVAEHRRWMLRNHALTLAAVSLRLYLLVALWAQWPFDTAYAAIAWLCWVPNLLLVQWWLGRA